MLIQIPKLPVVLLHSTSSPKLVQTPYTGNMGFYSAVKPDADSEMLLQSLSSDLGYSPDREKLHVTVMYSKHAPHKSLSCDEKRVFKAYGKAFQHWDGHDKKGYLSLALTSQDLQDEHDRLTNLGCAHTFMPYQPHVTIWSGVTGGDELQEKLDAANKKLGWTELRFTQQFISDLDN